MIHNMLSEGYTRDEEYAYPCDFENGEADKLDNDEVLNTSPILKSSASQNLIVFCSFEDPIILVSSTSIAPESDGISIKIEEISYILGNSCCNDADF